MIIVYILITVLMIGVLVLVHEFGHFIAARYFDVKVEEFAIGMGPALYQKETENTLYSIRLFPIGGYCSLQGETDEVDEEPAFLLDGSVTEIEVKKDPDFNPEKSFINKPVWQRFIILVAGVSMNFIFAIVILYIALILTGHNPLTSIYDSFRIFFQLIGLIFLSIKMLFTGEAGVSDLTGPVGIVQVVQTYYSYGFIYLLLFTAMLSVNLGILNLLPIPALDGGQILFLLIEKIKKGSVNERLKGFLFTISYILLLVLGIYIAINDFTRFMR